MTARRPDHIRLSVLVQSQSTHFMSTPAPSLAMAPRNEVIIPAILAGFFDVYACFDYSEMTPDKLLCVPAVQG